MLTSTTPTQDDLLTGVTDDVRVTIDRWSAGQLGIVDGVIALVVLAVAVGLGWLVRRGLHRMGRRRDGVARSAFDAVGQVAAAAILLFAVALGLEVLGFGLGPIVVLALIVVFAVQLLRPFLSNMSAGLLLQLRRAFDLGDVIETLDRIGRVEEITARTVVLHTVDGRRVHIPATDVLESTIVNHTALEVVRSSVRVTVWSRRAARRLEAELPGRLTGVDGIAPEHPVVVLHGDLHGSRIELEIHVWHPSGLDAERVARDRVGRAVLDVLEENGFGAIDQRLELIGSASDVGPAGG